MQFVVEMKRTQTALVRVEAASLKEARQLLADEDARWEYFTTQGDGYQSSPVKIVSVKPAQ